MITNSAENKIQQTNNYIQEFFLDEHYSTADINIAIENNDIFCNPLEILPYLQSALLGDQIIEIEIDNLTRVYFSRFHDNLPPLVATDDDGDIIYVEPDYVPAEYLKKMDHIISWPLEPSLGNLTICHSKKVLFRLFTSSYAVELGTYFLEKSKVRGVPCLRFSYPVIGRIVRGTRAFRATVPDDFDLVAKVVNKTNQEIFRADIINISAQGMAFKITKEQLQFVAEFDDMIIEVEYINHPPTKITANVRHISKVRGTGGTNHLCGVQFDLETRTIASEIESIVAQVQRAHLKKLSNLSEENNLKLIP